MFGMKALTDRTIPKSYRFSRAVSILFFFLSILFLLYVYYKAEVLYEGAKNDQIYFVYYLIGFSLIVFWTTVLKIRDEWRLNAVLVWLSFLSMLYVMELLLFFFLPMNGDWESGRVAAAKKLGLSYDTRAPLDAFLELRNSGKDVSLRLPSGVALTQQVIDPNAPVFPLSPSVSHKYIFGSRESGKFGYYISDRYGFNNPDSEWDKDADKWMFIGDSFCTAAYLRAGEDIPSRVRDRVSASVLNLGRPGHGPLSELAVLREYCEFVKPKKVFILYFEGNDLVVDLPGERIHPMMRRYLDSEFSQNLRHRQAEVDQVIEDIIEKGIHHSQHIKVNTFKKGLIGILKLGNLRNRISIDDRDTIIVGPLFRDILEQFDTRVSSWEGQLYFVYLPEYFRYSLNIEDHDAYRSKAEVLDAVRLLDIPIIDLHEEIFEKEEDPLSFFPFRLLGHYLPEVHHIIADVILSKVED